MIDSLDAQQILWGQILDNVELPSTRLLLQQQAKLHDITIFGELPDTGDEPGLNHHTVIRLEVSRHWLRMVKSRGALVEAAARELVGSVEVVFMEAA